MRTKLIAAMVGVVVLAATAHGQKVIVKIRCSKPDQEYSMSAGDPAGYVYGLSHTNCTYVIPGELAGLKTKSGSDTVGTEMQGNRVWWRGTYVATFTNGDKLFYRHYGEGTVENKVFKSGTDHWAVVSGTGKLSRYNGTGACSVNGTGDGGAEDQCVGDYTLQK